MTARRVIEEIIPDALDGERIDRIVALVADVSRREAVELVSGGHVTVGDGRPEKPSVRVEAGWPVTIEVPERADGMQPEPDVAFEVVHADEHTIVVDKPAGLVVHPGSGVVGGTLANGLLARFPEVATVGEAERPGIVHRLDRGTSGLLMVARTDVAYESLVSQLAARTVERVYVALVDGIVAADSGLVDAPLGRSSRDATRRAVVADGRPARTRYEVVERFDDHDRTLIRCKLETGRTHQIRVHLAAIDHPVAGDDRYGGSTDRARSGGAAIGRPFLHAAQLGFEHPTTGSFLRFEAELPADLRGVLVAMGHDRPVPVTWGG